MPLEDNINKLQPLKKLPANIGLMDAIIMENEARHYKTIKDFQVNTPISDLKFITITIRPHVILCPSGKKQTAKRQYLKVINSLTNYLDNLTNDYVMIAELTKAGAIHFHAIVNITDLFVAVLTDSLNSSKHFGNTQIDKIDDSTHLHNIRNYLLKDYGKTFYVVNRLCNHEDDTIDIFTVKTIKKTKPLNKSLEVYISHIQEEDKQTNFQIDFST